MNAYIYFTNYFIIFYIYKLYYFIFVTRPNRIILICQIFYDNIILYALCKVWTPGIGKVGKIFGFARRQKQSSKPRLLIRLLLLLFIWVNDFYISLWRLSSNTQWPFVKYNLVLQSLIPARFK